MRRRVAFAVAVAAVLTSCSSGHSAAAPTTTTAQAATPNPDVVPTVITPAYVDAVFKVLNHVNGNAVRALVASGAVSVPVKSDLRAIFGDPLFQQEVTIARQSLSADPANIRKPPGDRLTQVIQLLAASKNCIFVSTSTSLAAVLIAPPQPAASEYYGFHLKDPVDDPLHLNPTPWVITFNATYLTPTTIPNQCGN